MKNIWIAQQISHRKWQQWTMFFFHFDFISLVQSIERWKSTELYPWMEKSIPFFIAISKTNEKKTYVKSINKFIISDLLMSSSLRVALLGMHVWQTVIMALENCPKDSYNSAKKRVCCYFGGGKTVENALFIVFFATNCTIKIRCRLLLRMKSLQIKASVNQLVISWLLSWRGFTDKINHIFQRFDWISNRRRITKVVRTDWDFFSYSIRFLVL